VTKFPWFDQLAELSVECAPEGWEICSDYRNRWIYHRYDELFNADQYVEVMALVYPNSRKVLVEVHIRSELHKSEWGKGNSRKFSTMTFTPECRSDLADCIKQAYKEVDRLNPTL
jgi:hypothetical protein